MDGIDQLTKVIASGEEDVLNHRLRWTHLAVAVMPSKVEKVEDLHDSAHVTGKLRLDPGQLFPPTASQRPSQRRAATSSWARFYGPGSTHTRPCPTGSMVHVRRSEWIQPGC